jgi:isoleucyl-tRNA synthetase
VEILRLWLASSDYSGELSISKEILDRVVETYRRLRNTLRFLLANIADYDPVANKLPVAKWLTIDRYALALTRELQERSDQRLHAKFEFHRVVQALQHFASEDLGALLPRHPEGPPVHDGARFARPAFGSGALWHITQTLVR